MNSKRRISCFPSFDFRGLQPVARTTPEYLKQFSNLFDLGRIAVHWAFQGMKFPAGSPAWVPSFHCGVEVEAVAAAGFEVGFYRVGDDLALDLQDLADKVKARPGPVLTIHYFGFPQPDTRKLVDLCRDLGIPLIEDCAHALFSKHESVPLGQYAPIAVFSLAKTLSVFRGGALQIDRDMYRAWTGHGFQQPLDLHTPHETYRFLLKNSLRRLLGNRMTNIYRKVRYGSDSDIPDLTDSNSDNE